MALLPIVQYPAEILARSSQVVTAFDEDLRRLAADMAETMYAAEGVGLAAPQVNESLQLIVLDDGHGLIELINPEILEKSDETNVDTEGCLSIPGYYGKVERASKIKVRSLTRHGKTVIYEPEGFLARIFQHEIDHLYGHLFIEKATDLRKVGD